MRNIMECLRRGSQEHLAKKCPHLEGYRAGTQPNTSGRPVALLFDDAELAALATDMPSKGDKVEEGLYATYKAGLWKHTAEKKGLLPLVSEPLELETTGSGLDLKLLSRTIVL